MNLFYINTKSFACLMLITNLKATKTVSINENLFFYNDNQQLVGFNIFNDKYFKSLIPGRINPTIDLIDLINQDFKLDLKLSDFSFFQVAKIIECEPIVNTHLSKCLIDVNKEQLIQVVCGAKNAKKGLVTVFANLGCLMNNNLFISPSKLQNIDSYGMLCSQKELNLNQFNNEGIIELNQDQYPIGSIFTIAYSHE